MGFMRVKEGPLYRFSQAGGAFVDAADHAAFLA